jgi:hypothetical protein
MTEVLRKPWRTKDEEKKGVFDDNEGQKQETRAKWDGMQNWTPRQVRAS